MKPGRELDALIADKIMGWVDVEPSFSGGGQRFFGRPLGVLRARAVPQFSTDISSAWGIVERLRVGGFLFSINMADDWEVEFNLNDGRFLQNADTVGMANADTAPHAICLAALKAWGVSD